jgi:hypothetical protein
MIQPWDHFGSEDGQLKPIFVNIPAINPTQHTPNECIEG